MIHVLTMRRRGPAAAAALAVLLLAAGAASPADPPAAPSAHNPCFQDKALWPNLDGKEAFPKEAWPKARLLVWGHPGKDCRGGTDLSPQLARNWIDAGTGRPADSLPDKETDVLIPASDTPYTVVSDWGTGRMDIFFRHITVGRGAHFRVEHYECWGNIWVQEGGMLGSHHATSHKGTRHTFVRNDNPYTADKRQRKNAIAQYILVNKPRDASVEFLGHVQCTDEMVVNEGTAIVGPGSTLEPGPNSIQTIRPGAALVLLSGAFFGKHTNSHLGQADVVVAGRLLAGTADRPLTRDATLGLSFKAYDAADRVGLLVEEGGRLQTHSTDPKQARLVIRWHGKEPYLPRQEHRDQWGSLPKEIALVVRGEAALDGVEFHNLRKGGIRLADPSVRAAWRNVVFGPDNATLPDELFARYEPARKD